MTNIIFPRGSKSFRFPRRSKIESYRSNISLAEFNGKLYVDNEFGFEVPKIKVQYAVFSSKWDIEVPEEKKQLKIIHRDSGDSITLGFESIIDRVEFVNNIFASRPVKQIGVGMNLEKFANKNVLPKYERREPFRRFTEGFKLKEKLRIKN